MGKGLLGAACSWGGRPCWPWAHLQRRQGGGGRVGRRWGDGRGPRGCCNDMQSGMERLVTPAGAAACQTSHSGSASASRPRCPSRRGQISPYRLSTIHSSLNTALWPYRPAANTRRWAAVRTVTGRAVHARPAGPHMLINSSAIERYASSALQQASATQMATSLARPAAGGPIASHTSHQPTCRRHRLTESLHGLHGGPSVALPCGRGGRRSVAPPPPPPPSAAAT